MSKTILITGASRGIGRAAAKQLALEGHQVAIHYVRNQAAAETLMQEIIAVTNRPRQITIVQGDITCREQVDTMIQTITQTLGPIEVLVNNAGIAQQKMFCDITDGDWEQMFAVNVKGPYHCIQAVLPDMVRKKEGKILTLSSIWGITGASCEVHYSAAKAAVIGMTKALAKELAPSGIQVNCIAPGVIATDMNANLTEETLKQLEEETPLGRIGTPEDIAGMLSYLISPQADFITGQVLSPNGGLVI